MKTVTHVRTHTITCDLYEENWLVMYLDSSGNLHNRNCSHSNSCSASGGEWRKGQDFETREEVDKHINIWKKKGYYYSGLAVYRLVEVIGDFENGCVKLGLDLPLYDDPSWMEPVE